MGLGICVVIFLATNVTCAVFIKQAEDQYRTDTIAIMVRVVINDTLFLFCGFGLAYFIYRMSKMSAANMVLEAKVSERVHSQGRGVGLEGIKTWCMGDWGSTVKSLNIRRTKFPSLVFLILSCSCFCIIY